MIWEKMSDRRLISIMEIAVRDSDSIIESCYCSPVKKIRNTVEKLKCEIDFLKTAESKENAAAFSNARAFLYELYGIYRLSLQELVKETQWPFTAELLLDSALAEEETLELLDHKTDGIYVYADEKMIRIRIPPLPHKNNPRLTVNGWKEKSKISSTGVYSEALYRVLSEKSDDLLPVRQGLGKKTIHILNVFSEEANPIDNDNRDTGSIVNMICGFLPCGDVPYLTRICNDGFVSTAIPEGTYITVLPYENGLADNEKTIRFWSEKLSESGFIKKDISPIKGG